MRPNDDCLVFTATLGGTTALLEGDAERPVERRVVGEHPEAMLLKVAHHGSASGTSARCSLRFIRAMRSFRSAQEMCMDIRGVKCWSGWSALG